MLPPSPGGVPVRSRGVTRLPPPRHPTSILPPPESQARDRLLAGSPEELSTLELLTVLLAPGGRPRRAEGEARRLLGHYGTLRGLAAASAGEIRGAAGVAPSLAQRIAAAFALGRRVHAARLPTGQLLARSEEIYEAFGDRLRDLRKERFLSVLLDGRNRVIRENVVSEGTLTASLVHPREVFAPAIRESAGSILLVHNHPSGDPEPSPEDLEITRRLCAVGELVGIHVLDHVVIGDGGYVSFLERGLIP